MKNIDLFQMETHRRKQRLNLDIENMNSLTDKGIDTKKYFLSWENEKMMIYRQTEDRENRSIENEESVFVYLQVVPSLGPFICSIVNKKSYTLQLSSCELIQDNSDGQYVTSPVFL